MFFFVFVFMLFIENIILLINHRKMHLHLSDRPMTKKYFVDRSQWAIYVLMYMVYCTVRGKCLRVFSLKKCCYQFTSFCEFGFGNMNLIFVKLYMNLFFLWDLVFVIWI